MKKIGNHFIESWNKFIQSEELYDQYPLYHAIEFVSSLHSEVYSLVNSKSRTVFRLFVWL